MMRVKNVMTRTPVSIDPETPIATAAAVMRERSIRHLPVVADGDKLVGIVSDRDIRDALFAPAFAERLSPVAQRRLRRLSGTLETLRVRDVMTWDAVTIEPDALVAEAAALMFEGRFGCLPVLEKGKLVGIVTERDVLKALAQALPPVRGVDLGTYLW
jgi:acetoin utilization protein AcuB